jgi:phosphohistidine phosphatase SixA
MRSRWSSRKGCTARARRGCWRAFARSRGRVGSVLVIGHDPALGELALALASEGAELARMREKCPTAALATIDLPADRWSALERGGGELVAYLRPRDLG